MKVSDIPVLAAATVSVEKGSSEHTLLKRHFEHIKSHVRPSSRRGERVAGKTKLQEEVASQCLRKG